MAKFIQATKSCLIWDAKLEVGKWYEIIDEETYDYKKMVRVGDVRSSFFNLYFLDNEMKTNIKEMNCEN